jgi:hypothetical protein
LDHSDHLLTRIPTSAFVCIELRFSSVDDFTLHGTFGNVWTNFWLSLLGGVGRDATVIKYIGTRVGAKIFTMHRTVLTIKNYLAQKVNSVGVVKLCHGHYSP